MYYAVNLPWGVPRPKELFFDAERRTWFYRGPMLPAALRPYASTEYSRERWQEDEKNSMVTPPPAAEVKFTPKPHQMEAGKKIANSYSSGWSEFLLADKTGIGKTLSALVGVSLIARMQGRPEAGRGKLLIVSPKGVIPQWRNTLNSYPIATTLLRPLLINYDQLQKLLETPAEARVTTKRARKLKKTAAKGKPLLDFDYVIFDEAHKLKNFPSSLVSHMAVSVAKLDKAYVKDKSPFVIFSTATPGSSPLNFSVMSRFVAKLLTPTRPKTVTPQDWGAYLEEHDFAVKKGKKGWSWADVPWYGKGSDDPAERRKYELAERKAKALQRADAQRIGKALISKNAPFIMRSPKDIEGWPEQQFIPLPIELTSQQRVAYAEAWSRFRDWLNLSPTKKDPKSALVESLRYRQKSSLLRVPALIEPIEDWVAEGKQVYISCEFLETVDAFIAALTKKGIPVAEASGRVGEEREAQRLRFQRGQAKVIISTLVEGISFHAGEVLPDGTKATAAERITILEDIRQNPLDTLQTAGRAHRDGQNSLTYIPYAENTVDEKVVLRFTNKAANIKALLGSSVQEAEEMDRIFRQAAARRTPPNRLS